MKVAAGSVRVDRVSPLRWLDRRDQEPGEVGDTRTASHVFPVEKRDFTSWARSYVPQRDVAVQQSGRAGTELSTHHVGDAPDESVTMELCEHPRHLARIPAHPPTRKVFQHKTSPGLVTFC